MEIHQETCGVVGSVGTNAEGMFGVGSGGRSGGKTSFLIFRIPLFGFPHRAARFLVGTDNGDHSRSRFLL